MSSSTKTAKHREAPVTLASCARSVGQGDSSVESQHRAALAFWSHAVALVDDGILPEHMRAVAEAEFVRHTAALQPVALNPYSAPPYRVQPV